MHVEIVVLSGSDVGRRLTFDAPRLCAGDTADCEVYFDPQRDPSAAGCRAELAVTVDGWQIRNAGRAGLMVNHQLVSGPTHLKSGDVVRMSDRGPDFSFTILASVAAGTAPQFMPNAPSGQVEASKPEPRPGFSVPLWWVASGAAVLVILLLAVLVGIRWPGDRTGDRPVSQPVAAVKPADSGPPASAAPERPPSPAHGPEPAMPVEASNEPPKNAEPAAPKPEKPPPGAIEQLRGAVCLVFVEDPKAEASWPFATATAIGKTTLLTSASVAVELEQFRSKGWNIKVAAQGRGTKVGVREVRVHAAYPTFKSAPEKRAHVDLALLKLADGIPTIAPLATVDDLQAVEPGLPVICLGIPHEGDAVNRFQAFEPAPFEGKVFLVTALPSPGAVQRLLHFQGTVPPHLFGAPVVNRQGRVLGVYAGVSSSGNATKEGEPPKGFAVHLAPLIDPDAVRSGIDSASSTWIPPTPPTDHPASP